MFDIYAEITSRMISEMENGVIPWQKPWMACGAAISHTTGKPYSLLNQMLLGRAGEYLTYKQVQQEGGFVKKGEKAHMVVFWKFLQVKDEETDELKEVLFLRYYNVFHLDQCEGIAAKHAQVNPNPANPDQTAESIIEAYITREGVKLNHTEGDRAFYQPSTDSITLPLMAQFTETAEYYGTAFHEMVHSTGHTKRLNRLDKCAAFGSEIYSTEELVAEIGSASLLATLGIETGDTLTASAAYIKNWLKALKNDKRMIVSAASRAEKAVALILNRSSDQNTMME